MENKTFIKYKVINTCTGEDITNKYDWVITPNGELNFNYFGDLIEDPKAMYIIEDIE